MHRDTAVRYGITTLLIGSDNSFRSAITQVDGSTTAYNLYHHIAPQYIPSTSILIAEPFVVFDFIITDKDRDSATKFYEYTLQFRIVAGTLTQAETIQGYLEDLFDDGESALVVADHSVIQILSDPVQSLGVVNQLWNIVVPYRLLIQ